MERVKVGKSTFVGVVIGDISTEYEVVRKLGQGSFGVVLEVRHKLSGQHRAVKMIPKSRISNKSQLMTEISLMKDTDTPQIVKIFDVFEDAQNVHMVLELCEGGDLFSFIIQHRGLSERDASVIFRQLLLAVNYLHSHNVSHRDLKPENLMFAEANNIESLKLIDFGLAKIMENSGEKMKTVVGSPYYISPDVLRGTYGLECDMWSAGVILYVLLCGYPPFTGKSQGQILKKVSKGLYNFPPAQWDTISEQAKELVQQLMLLDPTARLTAQQALEHPWFSSSPPQSVNFDLSALCNFVGSAKLQQTILLCIASLCSEREISELKRIFQKIDVNGDGIITHDELHQALISSNTETTAKVVSFLDLNLNGVINYSEFLAATLDQKLYLQEEKLLAAFRTFDKDHNGRITADELRSILEEDGEASNEDTWKRLIEQADTNGDGEIDYQEFAAMMKASSRQEYH